MRHLHASALFRGRVQASGNNANTSGRILEYEKAHSSTCTASTMKLCQFMEARVFQKRQFPNMLKKLARPCYILPCITAGTEPTKASLQIMWTISHLAQVIQSLTLLEWRKTKPNHKASYVKLFVFSGSRRKVPTPLSRLDKHFSYNCTQLASVNNNTLMPIPVERGVWTGSVLPWETMP